MTICGCEQPTTSGCRPYYGWHDVNGNFKDMTTDEEKEEDWLRRLKIARANTRKVMNTVKKPIDKKEE